MRVRPFVAVAMIATSACVGAAGYTGKWEHKDADSFFRLELERDGTCTILAGGQRDGIGGRCRYSEREGSICIEEISAFHGNAPPEKVACGLKFTYESQTDTISMEGQSRARLVRTETSWRRP
jgi:hypothetical protein